MQSKTKEEATIGLWSYYAKLDRDKHNMQNLPFYETLKSNGLHSQIGLPHACPSIFGQPEEIQDCGCQYMK